RRSVVPQQIVFHKRDALAFDGACDDRKGLRSVRYRTECSSQGSMIVTINLDGVPTERSPLFSKWFERQHVFNTSETLNGVEVDNSGELRQVMVAGEERSFPD